MGYRISQRAVYILRQMQYDASPLRRYCRPTPDYRSDIAILTVRDWSERNVERARRMIYFRRRGTARLIRHPSISVVRRLAPAVVPSAAAETTRFKRSYTGKTVFETFGKFPRDASPKHS